MKFYLIVNPVAGNHRGEKIAKQFIKYLDDHHILSTVFYTNQAASFKQLLTHILKRIKQDNFTSYRCIVIGGDGTLNEILNALVSIDQIIDIAYFPAGTGNDFNREIKQISDIKQWLHHQLTLAKSTELEYLSIEDTRNHFQHIALNSLGVGLDAQVCHLAKSSKLKRTFNALNLGKLSYPSLLVKSLPERQAFQAQLIIDHQNYQLNDLLLLTIANHKYYGGGIEIAPLANQNDHTMHIIAVKNDKLPKLMAFAQQLLNKNHCTHELCQYFTASTLQLTIPQASVYLQIDGEAILLNYPQLNISFKHYPIWL